MIDTIAIEREMGRALALHPEPVDIIRFIGAANVKLQSIQHKTDHHANSTDMRELKETKQCLIQMAVLSLRCIDFLGGMGDQEHERHISLTKDAERRYECPRPTS